MDIRAFMTAKPKDSPPKPSRKRTLADDEDEPVVTETKPGKPSAPTTVSDYFANKNTVQRASTSLNVAQKKTKKTPVIELDSDDDDLLASLDESMLDATNYEDPPKKPQPASAPAAAKTKSPGRKLPSSITGSSSTTTKASPAKPIAKVVKAEPVKAEPIPVVTKPPAPVAVKEDTPVSSPAKRPADSEEDSHKLSKREAYQKFLAKKSSGPKAPGSKEIPVGAENCLAGKTFVFTGDMSSISRDAASSLVMRYGGRATSAVSSKTTYLVVGEDPGATKLTKAKSLKVPTLDEDAFFDLIRTLPAQSDDAGTPPSSKKAKVAKTPPRSKTPTKAPPSVAAEVKKETTSIAKGKAPQTEPRKSKAVDESSSLWTDKYRPRSYADIIGNKTLVERLGAWLHDWNRNSKQGFKKGSSDYSTFRAVLLSGPPGIGKTTAAHLVAENEGFEAIEFNASDTRSKNSLDSLIKVLSQSHTVTEYFSADRKKKPQVIIMDEVDGMSAGDRGGMAELIRLIKKSQVPIICICNDRQSMKVRSLAFSCLDLRFRRPTADQAARRLTTIAEAEGLHLKPNVIHQLVESTQADIRQILNILSTWRVSHSVMTYDESTSAGKDKDKVLNVWQIVERYLGAHGYRSSTLAQKQEYYFTDHMLIPLFIQENYIKCAPMAARDSNKPANVETLRLLSRAADAIAEGDLVDTVLHRNNQWGLMPVHAMFSCVMPSAAVHGSGFMPLSFPSWLGNFSKSGKQVRLLQASTRCLRKAMGVSQLGVRADVAPYLVQLWHTRLTTSDAVIPLVDFLEQYNVPKEIWDWMSNEALLADFKLDKTIKAAITRASGKLTVTIPVASRSTAEKSKADFEDAVESDDDQGDAEEEEEEETGVGKDPLVKAPKAKPKKAAKAPPRKKK